MKNIFILIISLVLTNYLFAQEKTPSGSASPSVPDLITDRPDQTESTVIVPKNSLQIETGFVFEKVKNENFEIDNWGIATTLLRYGVWDNFELRLGSYYQSTQAKNLESEADSTQSGFGPLVLGFKVYVVEEKGIRPEIAVLANMTLRHFGNLDYRPVYSFPTAILLFSHTLSDRFSIGYNTGFRYNGSNADGFFIYSFVTGYSITKKLSAFGEVYGNFDHGHRPNHKIDGGFTWLVKPNFQLDISGGTGFDDKIDKYFVSAGFTWRIPK